MERYRDPTYKWRVAACYLWGVPWAAVGVALCATVIFIPLGLLAFGIAGWPLARQQSKHMERKQEWLDRDRPLPNEAIRPWLLSVNTETPSHVGYEIDAIEPDA